MPYLCEGCFEYAHQVSKTRKSEFPTVASAQKWNSIPAGTSNYRDADSHADIFKVDVDGDDPDDDPVAFSFLVNSTLHAVRSIVRAQSSHATASAFSSNAFEVPKELIVSSLTRVYAGKVPAASLGDSSPDDGGEDSDASSSTADDESYSSASSNIDGGKKNRGITSVRRRFAPCTTTLQRRAGPIVQQKLSAILRESRDEEFKDDLQIDIRPEDLLRLEGGGKQFGGDGAPSEGPSRSTSNSNLALLRRKNASDGAQKSSASHSSGGTSGAGGGGGAYARSRSVHYLHRGGDEETLREHFVSASLTADSESARRIVQERKLTAAKKLLDQHKKVLRQRYEASLRRAAGGGGAMSSQSTQRSGDSSIPTDPAAEDPFKGTGPLAQQSRRVFNAHKRMYFADVPPPAAIAHQNSMLAASAHSAFHPQMNRAGSRYGDVAMNVRLSALEEVHEEGISENSILGYRGERNSTAEVGGREDESDLLEQNVYAPHRRSPGDASITINPADMQTIRAGWEAPF